jgi:uncharacterized protein (TIGR02246 family)
MAIRNPQDVHRLFADAFNAADLDGLMGLYAADAQFVPEPGKVLSGQAALREALQGFLGLRGRIHLETRYVLQAGDISLLSARWQLTGKGPDDQPLALGGNSTEVMRQQPDGSWLYVIDHPYGAD